MANENSITRVRLAYPHCSFGIIAEVFATIEEVKILSDLKLGRLMRKLSHGAMAGDLAPLKRHPWVGLFHRGGQDRMSIPLYVKRAVLAEGKCRLCGSTENPHIDHIRPYSKGGTNERENLQRLCATCNTKKAAKWEGLQ